MSDYAAGDTYMPAVQGINIISDKPTDDHKALVIRLELGYVDYAALEELAQAGVLHLEARRAQLQEMYDAVAVGDREAPYPLNLNDLSIACHNAAVAVRKAAELLKTIKRPPPVR